MCGIAGVISADLAPDAIARTAAAMADRLRHRGPDDAGLWTDPSGRVALAHRRLSIFDLSPLARQPMESPSGRLVVVFNGAIYNFRDLRAELAASGVVFRSTSDTEVLAAGFERWGTEPCLKRLVGMFAVAVWDTDRRRLTLARDRAGQKPLYYGVVNGTFAFASEATAFMALPGFGKRIDATALALYARYACVPAPHCIFAGLAKLPPGHVLEISGDPTDWSDPKPIAYWRYGEVPSRRDISFADAGVEAERLVAQAVTSQMIADVPLGAFLSGGFDSTAVVAMMAAHASSPVQTFTVGSTDETTDESAQARAVAHHFGTRHTEIRATAAETQAVITDLPAIYDEPFADPSQIPTVLVSRLARSNVTVALSGDGGDEVFGGYNRHLFGPGLYAATQRLPGLLRGGIGALMRQTPPGAWRIAGRVSGRAGLAGHAAKIARALPATDAADLYDRLVQCWEDNPLASPTSPLPTSWGRRNGGDDIVNSFTAADFTGYLPDDILVKVDRATMSVGLEGRAPFLDHRLVDFMASLPGAFKAGDGLSKRLLRGIVYGRIPRALMDRPKRGFDLPIGAWLRGPLRAWAESLLAPAALAQHSAFSPSIVGHAWQDHLGGRADRAHELWSVLMFESWARHNGVTA